MKAGWITVDEAAVRSGLSKATVRRMCGDGRLNCARVGKKNWAIDPSTLPAPKQKDQGVRYDLPRAFEHLFTRDVKEDLWVPDVLRFEDIKHAKEAVIGQAAHRLKSGGPFDPPHPIDVQKTPFLTRAATHLTFTDRLCLHGVVAAFADTVEQRLQQLDQAQGCTIVFSARRAHDPKFFLEKGTDHWVLWKAAIEDAIDDGYEWMVKSDITTYFDAIQHRILLQDLSKMAVHRDALTLLRDMLNSWSAVPGLGIPQGPDAARVLGNAYLIPVDEEMVTGPCRYLRFMDDIRIMGRTEDEALRGLTTFEKACRTRGLVLADHKTDLLQGDDARKDLQDADLDEIQYLWNTDQKERARPLLRKVLRSALRNREVHGRRAKFSLWRLAQLLDQGLLSQVLDRLENLAPWASVVAAYVQKFATKPRVERRVSDYLEDSSRNRSPFLSTWLLAAMLDAPDPLPRRWVDYARSVAKSTEPIFHRVLAVNVLARGRQANDLRWIQDTLNREFNPDMARGMLVALARVEDLPNWLIKNVTTRIPATVPTATYLRGRKSLPSLIWTDRSNRIE